MPRSLTALLWIARIAATLIVVWVAAMLVGSATHPQGNPLTPRGVVLLALFPIGMCVGYLLAWIRPLIGGIVSVVCIVVFLILLGEADMVGIVSLLGTPGVVFLLYGLVLRRLTVDSTVG
jgi:hypothetical protein